MRRLVISFISLLGVSLFLVGFSIFNFQKLAEANLWNIHTYRVLRATGEIDSALTSMDADVRNFLLAGNPQEMDLYARHRENFEIQWKNAYDLTSDRSVQQERLRLLRSDLNLWQQQVQKVIAIRRATPDTARSLQRTTPSAGKRNNLLRLMREKLNEMERTEEMLLELRQQKQEEAQQRTKLTLWIGAIFSILLSVGLFTLVASNTQRLARANQELARSNAEIEAARQTAERMQGEAEQAQAEAERARRKIETANRAIERSNLELQRSNEELGHFAYVASHDLQEPLRAISGCVQILQRRYEGQLDERADQFIQHAVDGTQRMQTLILDLLAYSRVGTHDQKLSEIEVQTLIAHVKISLSEQIAESNAQITQDAMPTVVGDAQQLEQVWQNFISNAIKFRGDKAPQIHLSATRDEASKSWVFSVSDHGPGIEPQYFERIWVMFQRLHSRSEYPGTGIGLAICKKIIERHGGTVSVESKVGEGTIFRFSIPDQLTDNCPLPDTSDADDLCL